MSRKKSAPLPQEGRPDKQALRSEYHHELARLVPEAIRVLEEQLQSEKAHIRQRAANSILDRRYGKAVQTQVSVGVDEAKERAVLESLSDEELRAYLDVLDRLRGGEGQP